MAPSGTVISIGPSVNPPNDFLSPRISIAAGMFAGSFAWDESAEEREDVLGAESGFGRFAERLHEKLARAFFLGVPAPLAASVGHERAEALAPVDDAFALEFLVGALHRNHTDEQVFGQAAKRRQRRAGREPALAHLARQAVHDLLIQRTRRGRRNRRDDEFPGGGSGHYQLYIVTIYRMSRAYRLSGDLLSGYLRDLNNFCG